MAAKVSHGHAGPGRPRSRAADAAIMAAALKVLGATGYSGMTIEAVADAAGVGKATIYRRFRSKEDLVSAAVARLTDPGDAPDTGDARRDVIELLGSLHQRVATATGAPVTAALIVEEKNSPELIRLFRRRVIRPRRLRLKQVLERGVARGEIDPSAALDDVIDVLTGAWFSRYLSGRAVTRDWARKVVAIVWDGISA